MAEDPARRQQGGQCPQHRPGIDSAAGGTIAVKFRGDRPLADPDARKSSSRCRTLATTIQGSDGDLFSSHGAMNRVATGFAVQVGLLCSLNDVTSIAWSVQV